MVLKPLVTLVIVFPYLIFSGSCQRLITERLFRIPLLLYDVAAEQVIEPKNKQVIKIFTLQVVVFHANPMHISDLTSNRSCQFLLKKKNDLR